MGETGDEYPGGTVYDCSFTGRMSFVEQADDYSFRIRVDELKTDTSAPKESIDDGIRFVTAEPYGISEGDEMILYRPGTPVSILSESMQMWAHIFDNEDTVYELENWFLSSEKNDSGFVAYQAATGVSLANPWQDVTAEELKELSGISFAVPEGAENVIFRWMSSGRLAEMQFSLQGDEYCARAQSVKLEEGTLEDISGMYFDWENEQEITVGNCAGVIGQAQTGSEDKVERCLWYNKDTGVMYSLSVFTTDLDGLDLTALAEQIMQD